MKLVDLTQYPKPETSYEEPEVSFSTGRGFLPPDDPILHFEDERFQNLANLCARIPALLSEPLNSERGIIRILEDMKLPELPSDTSPAVLKRINAMAVSLVHAYILKKGGDRDENKEPVTIPKKLSKWLCSISKATGRPPTQTYDTYVLQNYRLVVQSEGFELDNIEPLITYTNIPGEAWFIKMHVRAEFLAGAVLKHIEGIQDLYKKLPETIAENMLVSKFSQMHIALKKLANHLKEMNKGLSEKCFFDKVRPYLKPCEAGVIFKDVTEYKNGII